VNVFVQVRNALNAQAAAVAGADVIVLQGKGAGGFISSQVTEGEKPVEATDADADAASTTASPRSTVISDTYWHQHLTQVQQLRRAMKPLHDLIPEAVMAVQELKLTKPPLIIAAGGITSG
jgi:NAD(P)H-dependent flavin oxidoreductase YrpB (nitropropane dioxygenase family)